MSHVLELRGCAPEPLMAYLKALGIFRLVAEQKKDADARAWWQNDTFMLRSALDREALVKFFLEEYRPTPIVSPWNGGSGFYPKGSKSAKEAVDEIRTTNSDRLENYRQTIELSRRVLKTIGVVDKPSESEKLTILAKCRNQWPDSSMRWLDAVYVLSSLGREFMPLLGTGANDGNMEFSVNFIRNLMPSLTGEEIGKKPPRGTDPDERREGWLGLSILNCGDAVLAKRAVGQFHPGGVGGANATTGFQADSLINPWDFVLMMEGALLFAGAAARRLSSQASSKAVFPFTAVDGSAAGYGTSADSEYGKKFKAEFWAPLWDSSINLAELVHFLSEGRAQVGRGQGTSGTDFARAVAGLGIERGISQFQRFGFIERNGQSDLATPLGRFYVQSDKETTERANVLFDLDTWMQSLRGQARDNASLGTVLRQVEGAIIEFCQRGGAHDLQDVLIAVGRAERWISRSGLRETVRPVNLSWEWSRDSYDKFSDDASSFRLARAMSSILRQVKGQHTVGAIRENVEPVDTSKGTSWKEGSKSFVWTASGPLINILTVLERRCLEGRMKSFDYPPLASAYSAWLDDVVAFLNGEVDIQRVADLALPLSFVTQRSHVEEYPQPQRFFELPAAYAVMKLTLLPGKFVCPEFGVDGKGIGIAMEPSMLAMLRAGRVTDAYRVAYRRLKASGLRPLSEEPGIADRSDQGRRLAAALLFPLDESSYKTLAEGALRKPDRLETE